MSNSSAPKLPGSSPAAPAKSGAAPHDEMQDLRDKLAWLEERNSQLLSALEGLERERSHYFTLFDELPDAVCAMDEDGLILDANRHLAYLCGLSQDQLVGKPLARFIHEQDQSSFAVLLSASVDGQVPRSAVLRLMRRDLGARPVVARLHIPAATGGRTLFLVGFTELEAHEGLFPDELSRETERFRLAMGAGGVGIFDWDLTTGVLAWDEQMFRLYGVRREHFSGAFEAWRAGLHPEDMLRAESEVQQALRGERELDTEFRVVRPDGAIRSIRALGTVLRDIQGRPVRMVGTNWDITSRVELEEKLSASEANFRSFFDSVSDLLVVADMQGRIFYSNRSMRTKLGYSQDELGTMHVLDLHSVERRAEAEEIFAAMFRGTRDSSSLPLGRKDGGLFPVETRVWFGHWDKAECVFLVCKDLSEEEDAKQRFERLFRSNPCPMALSAMPQRWFVDVNDAFMKVLGYAWNDVVGKTSQEIDLFVEPEKQVLLGNLLSVGGRFADVEMKARRRDGEVIDGLFSGELVRSLGKTYFLTVMLDITARKKAEAALAVERERLAATIRGTDAGTWAWNVQTGETEFNQRWAAILGYTLEELAPVSIDTWMALAHPEDLQISGEALERHFSGETDYYECESRMLHKDGSWVWVLDRGRLDSRSEDGRPLMMFGTHQDITARKRAEEGLKLRVVLEELVVRLSSRLMGAGEDNLDQVIDGILAAIGEFARVDRSYLFRVNADRGSMSNTNEWCAPGIEPQMDQFQELPLDITPAWMEEMRRNRIVHIPRVADLPESWAIEREILESQDIQSLLALPIFSGEELRGFIGFDAVREQRVWQEEDQLILRFLADNVGLTILGVEQRRELRLASEESLRLAAAADAANRAKSLFLANISHEFRTPMNAILGFTQVLQQELEPTAPQHRHLRTIQGSGAQLLHLIDDILEMSRADTVEEACHPEAFSLLGLLRELEQSFGPRCVSKELAFSLDAQDGLPLHVTADPRLVRRILLQLLGNAVKFTSAGCVTLGAEIGRDMDGDRLKLWVRDTGPGIPDEERKQLFSLFQKGSQVDSSGGMGLGLALSARLAHVLGGRVQVESKVGEGSCFTLDLPLLKAPHALGEAELREKLQRAALHEPGLTVLVVDDQEDNRAVLREMLQPLSFRILEAENGQVAVERALGERPWLVLMDMRMPVMSGMDAVRQLRALPEGGALRIIAVTASSRDDEDLQLGPQGADRYLRKPFATGELLSIMADCLPGSMDNPSIATDASSQEIGESSHALPSRPEWLDGPPLAAMRQALEDGDTRRLSELLRGIAEQDASLARRLGQLLEAYDYKSLAAWLGME